MKENRNYGLDLLRILSMLGIVGLHVIAAGGMLSTAVGMNKVLAIFIHRAMRCSVNVFAMLSGYLYISKKRISSVSIIKLIFTVFFYCVIITGLFVCFRRDLFVNDKTLIIKSIFPPVAGRFWYITAYTFMFFMIPYINAFVNAIDKPTFKRVLIVIFVFLSCFTTFGVKDYFVIADGYSPFWLVFCYLTGAYIKAYGNVFCFSKIRKLLVFLLNVALVIFIELVCKKILQVAIDFSKYVSPFIYINALLLLEIFSEVEVKEKIRKITLSLSGAAFGVYIIHSHILVYDHLLTDKLSGFGGVNPVVWLLVAFCVIIAIYILGWIIEFLRKIFFKILLINKASAQIANKVDRILAWDVAK